MRSGVVVSMKILGRDVPGSLFETRRVVWYAQFNDGELDGDASGRVHRAGAGVYFWKVKHDQARWLFVLPSESLA